jgi:hypothetical protein
MGLLSVFRKNNNHTPDKITDKPVTINNELHKFGKEPGIRNAEFFPGDGSIGLDAIYAFFQDDYEARGYNDALTNPDDSYKTDNIRLFHHDLLILIDRSSSYYESFLKELDFHIGSRTRAGLIDLVEELKIRKEIVSDLLGKIKVIKEDAVNGNGATQRIALSYQRGFMRGLSAISQSKIFNRTL